MDFTFDFGWAIGGLFITIIGGLIVVFYRQVAENLANGVSSYDHVKLFGVITIIVGLIFLANLHIILVKAIASLFM